MNEKIVFVRTSSGEDEVRSRTAHLSKDIKRALLMVDGTASVAEIMRRASPSLRGMLEDMFAELLRGGFIQDKTKSSRPSAPPAPQPRVDEVDELDFTAAFRVPTEAMLAEEAARLARAESERARTAQIAAEHAAEAERVRVAHLEAERAAEAERARVAGIEAERVARQQAAERARVQAVRAKEAAEAARVQEHARAEALRVAAAQEKARLEAELAQLKAQAEAEARARLDAENKARQVAEAARAEKERLAREAAERIRAEKAAAEAARAEAERLARETDERIRAEKAAAEAARAETERLAREAERVRTEKAAAEAARAEAERLARETAERIRTEKAAADAARLQAEQMAREAARIKAEHEEAARAEAARSAREAAQARLLAEQHAAQVRAEAEQHAVEVRAEAEARAHAVAQERGKLEAEVAKLKALAESEAQARIEATAQAMRDAEAARLKAEREAELAREMAEHARAEEKARLDAERAAMRAEEQARAEAQLAEFIAGEAVRAEAARLLLVQNQALEEKRALDAAAPRDPGQWVARAQTSDDRRKTAAAVPGCDSRGGNNGVPIVERRTTTAAVVFYDIVGYTKQPDSHQILLKQRFGQLLTDSLAQLEASERIVLDTGDGAAIGFLQHPTDALESAIHFRQALVADKFDTPLRVRIGIHLGPVSLVKDMNGLTNMLGDGINSAQRVMSFAGQNQIYVSRAYFEFVSNLGNDYNDSFRYRGAQQDKHGREHQVYELLGADEIPVASDAESPGELGAFSLDAFDAALLQTEAVPEIQVSAQTDAADRLLMDSVGLLQPAESAPEEVLPAAALQADAGPAAKPAENPPPAEPPSAETPSAEPQYTEAEAKELADAQAKKWEEARLRASDAGNSRIFEPAAPIPAPAAPEVLRKPRRPLPWGKIAAGLLVLLLAALFVVPALLPMQAYQAGIERQLSAKLMQPVHVGHLEGRILPSPRLLLSDVSVGDAGQLKVRRAGVAFSLSGLFAEVKPIGSLELDGLEVASLLQTSDWLQRLAEDSRYPVSRIVLSQGRIDADGISFADVGGELDFDRAGKFAAGKLSAAGHKLDVEVHAAPGQKLQTAFSLRDGALPTLPNWVFEELRGSGELSRDELRITDLDGRIMGGALSGEVRINWRSGWRVQGTLAAKVIQLQNISKLLAGDMDGTARFQAQAGSLGKLADAVVLNGVFDVKKGLISGVDVVETARLRSRESLPGGRTHFDDLSGELFYANDVYQFRPVRMSDSVVKVAGMLTVNRKQLSGNVLADLTMRGGMGSVALQIDGTADSPTLHAAR